MGTIKCGFWKLRFILTPDEMLEWLQYCEAQGIERLEIPNYERTLHTVSQAGEAYRNLYNTVMGQKEYILVPGVTYSMIFQSGNPDKPLSSFHLISSEYGFYNSQNRLVLKKIYQEISYPKGFSVDCDDGIHFVYEDINLHHPNGQPLYEKVTSYIKNITSPLRYMANGSEQKPPVRISNQAAIDLSDSWLAKEYGWEVKLKNTKK